MEYSNSKSGKYSYYDQKYKNSIKGGNKDEMSYYYTKKKMYEPETEISEDSYKPKKIGNSNLFRGGETDQISEEKNYYNYYNQRKKIYGGDPEQFAISEKGYGDLIQKISTIVKNILEKYTVQLKKLKDLTAEYLKFKQLYDLKIENVKKECSQKSELAQKCETGAVELKNEKENLQKKVEELSSQVSVLETKTFSTDVNALFQDLNTFGTDLATSVDEAEKASESTKKMLSNEEKKGD